ncbi:hypothetical protein F5J12DRAFT_391490 [Pisolithus orientalis]|uniref:uncharacterized protein n=1 Tax=Pisolithus orientalis TaxID=936130 RepID=UPI0022246832|nr:uncharacterized protein F5J12DRAFT_391490 [Pisolithus orientalis]KAI6028702.1 hypothetical protein F5J12DRAFT_391490 [Pisolithus orientalis]
MDVSYYVGQLTLPHLFLFNGVRRCIIASTAHDGNKATQQPVRTPTTILPGSSVAPAVSSGNYSPPKAMGPPIPRKRRLSTPDSPTNSTRQRLDNNPTTLSVSIGRYALEDQSNSPARSHSESISAMVLSTIQSESTTTTTRHPRPHNHSAPFHSSSPQQTAAADIVPTVAVAAGERRCCVEEEAGYDVHYSNSGQSASERVCLLWQDVMEIRRQQMRLRDKEEVLLGEMEKLGEKPRPPSSTNSQLRTTSSTTERQLAEMEAELQEERDKRVRAEKALEEIERECRSPFVVPALFRAFMTISELSP